MSEQTIKILENRDEDITNYFRDSITLENQNKTINPIKKIELRNSTELNYQTLSQKASNYLKNLEMYKNLPDSIINNIIKSRKFISQNHNILFHHYSKEKKLDENNKKNLGRIQSIIINTNLKIFNKEKNIIRNLPNNSELIYYKKHLKKAKSTINSNRATNKYNNTSQSSIIANYETNYDYDYDYIYDNNNENFNYLNCNENHNNKKLNLNTLEKNNNYYNDISLKEYLYNETKTLRTAFNYFEKNEQDKKGGKNIEDKKIFNINIAKPHIKISSDNITFTHSQNTDRKEKIIKKLENKKIKGKYSCSNLQTNSKINNKIRGKNKSLENINSYSNRYKMKKIKYKLDISNNNKTNNNYLSNNYIKLLTAKNYNNLSSNGNFTTVNTKRKTFIEEEKNNFKRKKYNIYINTQNFYDNSKIDYISFRKNNINNNILKQKNKNILKHKQDKRIPCKLIKKDLNIITSTSKSSLNSGNKLISPSNKNNDKKINKKTISEPKIDKSKKLSNSLVDKVLIIKNKGLNKNGNFKSKIEDKKRIFFNLKIK